MTDIGPALVCYDGSDRAERAMRRAATLLRSRHAVVIRVSHGRSKGEVAETTRRLAIAAGFGPVAVVEARRGPTGRAVVEEAHEWGASVIVDGSYSSALLHHSDVPVLVGGAAEEPSAASEPIFMCYDGSRAARQALSTAADLLAGRAAIVAAFLPAVDDGVVLRSALPWPVAGETADRLAGGDRQEAEAPARRAAEGARAAATAGFATKPLGIPAAAASSAEEQNPWRRLLRAAAGEEAACIVVGHRLSVEDPGSTAHGLVQHADRPVLVVPSQGV